MEVSAITLSVPPDEVAAVLDSPLFSMDVFFL